MPKLTKTTFLIGILLTGSLLLILFNIFNPKSNTLNLNKQYSENINLFFKYKIGDRENTIDLKEVKNKENLSTSRTTYTFDIQGLNLQLITEGGFIVFKKSPVVGKNWTHPNLDVFLKNFGKAEREYKGSKTYGPQTTVFAYPSKGYAFIGNTFTNQLYEIQNFNTTTPGEYQKKWGEELLSEADEEYDKELGAPQNQPFSLIFVSDDKIEIAEPVVIRFNSPLDINSLRVSINPQINFQTLFSETNRLEVKISPENFWREGEKYTLIIERDTQNIDKNRLEKDYTFEFTVMERALY